MTWEEQIARAARRFQFRFAAALSKRFIFQWLGWVWIGAGTLILGVRILGMEISGLFVLFAIVGAFAAVAIAALWRATRLCPSRAQCLTWLDSATPECGGFLVAARETGLGGWKESLPVPEAPYLEVRRRGGAWMALLSVIYLIGAALGPVTPSPEAKEFQQDLAAALPELEGKFTLLMQEKLLTPEEELQVRNALTELTGAHAAQNAAQLYETLDQLARRAHTLRGEAVSQTRNTLASLGMLQAAASALGASAPDPAALTEFTDIMEQMAATPEIAGLVQKFSAANPGAMALTPEQLEELRQNLGGISQELESRLVRLDSSSDPAATGDGLQSMAEWLARNDFTAPALGNALTRAGGSLPAPEQGTRMIDLAGGAPEATAAHHYNIPVFPQHLSCVSRFFDHANQ